MNKVYQTKTRIFFRHADPGQIMFFGNLFEIAHDIVEEFVLAAGFEWDEWFANPTVVVPFRHVEGDYLRPLKAGQTYEVKLQILKLGTSSIQMELEFCQGDQVHGKVCTTQVTVDPKTMTKVPVPEAYCERLRPYLRQN